MKECPLLWSDYATCRHEEVARPKTTYKHRWNRGSVCWGRLRSSWHRPPVRRISSPRIRRRNRRLSRPRPFRRHLAYRRFSKKATLCSEVNNRRTSTRNYCILVRSSLSGILPEISKHVGLLNYISELYRTGSCECEIKEVEVKQCKRAPSLWLDTGKRKIMWGKIISTKVIWGKLMRCLICCPVDLSNHQWV